jgi:fructose-1,6-bisphosphatase II / sedoheptulose-1,7-bisphosphatase
MERAAVAAARLCGRGAEKKSDQAAVDAMRRELSGLAIDGTVVIGEGEMDEAPMLFIGEKVGTGSGLKVDIAVDPLEGTTLCAKNMPGAIATLALAQDGTLLHAPDIYMDKIAVGPGLPEKRCRSRCTGRRKHRQFGQSQRRQTRGDPPP